MFFTKLQSVGNDFILIETADLTYDWSSLSKAMCDRKFGIGADGLLLLIPSLKADFGMRMFNPDGSESEACGNGLRCLIKYIADIKLAGREITNLNIDTISGVRKANYALKDGKADIIQASMGIPEFDAAKIPVSVDKHMGKNVASRLIADYPLTIDKNNLLLSFVSMGNPHAIYFQDEPLKDFPLTQIGPKVENDSLFPKRVNFEVARIANRGQVDVRVWERGAGETLGCGSGACAVAVASFLLGYTDNIVDIVLPGGKLSVEWDGESEVLLSGIAEIVFTGDWKK
ncbi:MAG: diaminopimelate epimerase [Dehalococcoidales bacterium]|nr:diaminopimelate epimerase [Dehalococcoidales bacterium]